MRFEVSRIIRYFRTGSHANLPWRILCKRNRVSARMSRTPGSRGPGPNVANLEFARPRSMLRFGQIGFSGPFSIGVCMCGDSARKGVFCGTNGGIWPYFEVGRELPIACFYAPERPDTPQKYRVYCLINTLGLERLAATEKTRRPARNTKTRREKLQACSPRCDNVPSVRKRAKKCRNAANAE